MSDRDGYTPEFWTRALMLQNASLKMCEKCRVKHGEEITNIFAIRRPKKRTFATVRVALRVGRRIHPDNLGLFCLKCRRGAQIRIPKFNPDELMEPLWPKAN